MNKILKKNIEQIYFEYKLKIAFPIAVLSRIFTLGNYALIKIIEDFF